MKNLIIVTIIACLLLIACVDGIYIGGDIKFNGSMNIGETKSMITKFDVSGKEISYTIDKVEITGNPECKNFISTNTTGFFVKDPVYVENSIMIPPNTPNGFYQCGVSYLLPKTGDIGAGVSTPFYITITDGIESMVIDTPKIEETVIQTTAIPKKESTSNISSPTTTTHATIPVFWIIGCGIIVVGLIIGIIWIFKKDDPEENIFN